jgi:hypothetical protein
MAAPNFFKNFYRGGTGFIILTAASTIWLGINSGDQSVIAAGVAALLGAVIPATAERRVTNQIKDGTLGASPGDVVVNGLKAIVETQAAAKAEYDKVIDVVGVLPSIASTVPVVGPAIADSLEHLGTSAGLPGLAENLVASLILKSRETE